MKLSWEVDKIYNTSFSFEITQYRINGKRDLLNKGLCDEYMDFWLNSPKYYMESHENLHAKERSLYYFNKRRVR